MCRVDAAREPQTRPPPPAPIEAPARAAGRCGDIETPLGLCLCRSKYGEEPVAAPPERIPIYCDGTAVFRRTTLFSREPS